jgi:hypothetical protein
MTTNGTQLYYGSKANLLKSALLDSGSIILSDKPFCHCVPENELVIAPEEFQNK